MKLLAERPCAGERPFPFHHDVEGGMRSGLRFHNYIRLVLEV
jgi:hypothetical protein